MKKLNASEMRKIEGGISWSLVKKAWAAGAFIGKAGRIAYAHKKYGHCLTYAKDCPIC